MKRLLLLTLLCFGLSFTQAQTFNRPINPEQNIGVFGGPYLSFNAVDYVEYGALAGVNFKDMFLVGPYYQRSIKNNDFYGLYTQWNVNPKEYYFTLGFALRTGFVNGRFASLEPAMTMQSTVRDNIRITHQIGLTGGLPSYNIGIIFGNFGMKWWKNPDFRKMNSRAYFKKQEQTGFTE
jgi:hypothetical protein